MAQSTPSPDDAFKDSLNFVKKLWGGMGMPGMNSASIPAMQGMGMPLPTMSVDELDKRIQELKSVEAWLNVNVSMLHNTIQALEIQRATIATLHSLSSTMAQTMHGSEANVEKADENPRGGDEKKSDDDASAKVSPLVAQSAAWWSAVQEQFKQALGTALAATTNVQTAKPVTKHVKTPAAKAAPKTTSKAKLRASPKPRRTN